MHFAQKSSRSCADDRDMEPLPPGELTLIVCGAVVMTALTLRAIAQSAVASAARTIEDRREWEAQRALANAEAEAFGRRAAMEPLALNPDGTVEEPIIGVVETP